MLAIHKFAVFPTIIGVVHDAYFLANDFLPLESLGRPWLLCLRWGYIWPHMISEDVGACRWLGI